MVICLRYRESYKSLLKKTNSSSKTYLPEKLWKLCVPKKWMLEFVQIMIPGVGGATTGGGGGWMVEFVYWNKYIKTFKVLNLKNLLNV